jgi:hypothetical protein
VEWRGWGGGKDAGEWREAEAREVINRRREESRLAAVHSSGKLSGTKRAQCDPMGWDGSQSVRSAPSGLARLARVAATWRCDCAGVIGAVWYGFR